ncbi:Heat induced stress protein YflT [Alkalibacterium subtropicum]|uniref:Heat induced stress protein YflT n=1 Tax=Alkalibacterium subtropicum TaxID=753702 RepID=A0A1I1LI36_9LACT|nr:general stress protein [Alkalibacterium subtropicum]SFC72625.1 Heat induced stress protein YflT [Alkalibacterium subtropicum]
MDRHILGTFKNEEAAVSQVEKLLNEEGYSPTELMLVMDKNNQYDERIESIKNVKINKVEVEEESIWEKVKEAFSFGTYDSEGSSATLEEYGVPHDRADHYAEALKAGEIVLLADTDAPKESELSEVNEDIIENGEREDIMTEKKDAPIDEVNSEEPEAIKTKNTNGVETSENKKVEDSVDPSQANDMRKESKSDNNNKGEHEATQGKGSTEEPDLTGQEDTVEKEETEHGYGNKVAEGVVRPEVKSPLNTDNRDMKEPHENTEAPEAEANYSEELEEQGKKSWEDNK